MNEKRHSLRHYFALRTGQLIAAIAWALIVYFAIPGAHELQQTSGAWAPIASAITTYWWLFLVMAAGATVLVVYGSWHSPDAAPKRQDNTATQLRR
jgi:hypothetical protein